MELRVAGQVIKTYNSVDINLKYDSIADTFNFRVFRDVDSARQRSVFKPLTYHSCTIYHQGVLVMTGTCLSTHAGSSGNPPVQLTALAGYTTTGILEDVNRTLNLQFDGLTLKQMVERLLYPHGLGYVIDPEVSAECDRAIPSATIQPPQTIKDFIDSIAKQLNVVLSHTIDGRLLLTRVKADKKLTTSTTLVTVDPTPVSGDIDGAPTSNLPKTTTTLVTRATLCDFSTNGGKWIEMDLTVDGQKMHSDIFVYGAAQEDTNNAIETIITNPYIPRAKVALIFIPTTTSNRMSFGVDKDTKRAVPFRPKIVIQTQGDDNTAKLTARAILGDELKNIVLTIKVQGWTLNGHLITPNQMITVINPDVHLYKKTKFFIKEVYLHGDADENDTATLTCVLPECFNNDIVKNIFD